MFRIQLFTILLDILPIHAVEHKFASNNWNLFPPTTYTFLEYLNSAAVVEKMSTLCGVELKADFGLQGCGWHIHVDRGKL